MNAFADRDLRDRVVVVWAALCAAQLAQFRCTEQQNRGVSDPRFGARDHPAPCSGVAHATAVRPLLMRRALRRYDEPSACARAPERRVHMRAHRAQPRQQRVRHVDAGRAAIPHEMIELCSTPSMRSGCIESFARACGAAAALTASARSSEVCTCGWRPLHRTCRARVTQVLTTTASVAILRMSSPASRRRPSACTRRRTADRSPHCSARRRLQERHRLLVGDHGRDRDCRRAR